MKSFLKLSLERSCFRKLVSYKPSLRIHTNSWPNASVFASLDKRIGSSDFFSSSRNASPAATAKTKEHEKTVTSSDLKERVHAIEGYLSLVEKKIKDRNVVDQLSKLKEQMSKEGFWEDSNLASKVSQEHAYFDELIKRLNKLTVSKDNAYELASMALEEDEKVVSECNSELVEVEKKAKRFMAEMLLDQPADIGSCFIEVNAGAGGAESCDFSNMLLQMYVQLGKNMGFSVDIVDMNPGQDAGIKSGVIKIVGENAFGWLRTEAGVHRLVRISEYDSNHRRHTSFSQVAVLPVVDHTSSVSIELEKSELKIDTFKSSGPGGQHVNTTDSAVRITHLPTGLTVACQTQRSQHQNKAQAMEMLKSKILQKRIQEESETKRQLKSKVGSADFGNQIRSYVLHPYKMVKDHRTQIETTHTSAVFDGDYETILPFIEAALLSESQ